MESILGRAFDLYIKEVNDREWAKLLALTTEGASQIVRQGEQLNDDGLVQLPDNAVTGGITHRDKC